ncbi:MAG: hypothetical protein NVS3B20_10240 [Polyangiales bacterium]
MSRPRVLLVDDSEAILAYEQLVLGDRCDLQTAKDGREALAKMRAERPDLVLLDLSMPVLDGDAVLAEMQADETLKDTPVVIVSSERTRAETALRGGALAYVPKPIHADALLSAVERAMTHVERRRAEESLAAVIVCIGNLAFACEIKGLAFVVHQPATTRLQLPAIERLSAFIAHGVKVGALDVTKRFGVAHAARLVDRKIVIFRGDPAFGLMADEVFGPEIFGPTERFSDAPTDPRLRDLALSTVRRGDQLLAVIDPQRLIPSEAPSALSKWQPPSP